MIEGDPDLKFLNEINDRYGAKEFLVLTYTPKMSMIDEISINNLLLLKKDLVTNSIFLGLSILKKFFFGLKSSNELSILGFGKKQEGLMLQIRTISSFHLANIDNLP